MVIEIQIRLNRSSAPGPPWPYSKCSVTTCGWWGLKGPGHRKSIRFLTESSIGCPAELIFMLPSQLNLQAQAKDTSETHWVTVNHTNHNLKGKPERTRKEKEKEKAMKMEFGSSAPCHFHCCYLIAPQVFPAVFKPTRLRNEEK